VIGARPQFIKAAAVSRALAGVPGVEHLLVHTGQHYDDMMSDVFFRELDLPRPHRDLGIGSGPHGLQTGRMLEAVERVLIEEQPDLVVVHGDTNTTLAGALAAAKLHIPLAHVEAGLRSFNRRMPEEINRVLVDHASDLLLAPTQTAVENLRREGIPSECTHWVGDVMLDAALYYGPKAQQTSRILETLGLQPAGYLLATVHRAENTDDPDRLRMLLTALNEVGRDLPVVLPIHPRTRMAAEKAGAPISSTPYLRVIPPVGYLDMMVLERGAAVIATDSGGVQKEAYIFRVPCVTLREETEWVETVEAGANVLVGTEAGRLIEAVRAHRKRAVPVPGPGSCYGDGHASEKIARLLSGPAAR